MYATGGGKASVCPGAADLTPAPCWPSLCCVFLHLTAAVGSTVCVTARSCPSVEHVHLSRDMLAELPALNPALAC